MALHHGIVGQHRRFDASPAAKLNGKDLPGFHGRSRNGARVALLLPVGLAVALGDRQARPAVEAARPQDQGIETNARHPVTGRVDGTAVRQDPADGHRLGPGVEMRALKVAAASRLTVHGVVATVHRNEAGRRQGHGVAVIAHRDEADRRPGHEVAVIVHRDGADRRPGHEVAQGHRVAVRRAGRGKAGISRTVG